MERIVPVTELFPEDLLIATLHLVGDDVTLVDDKRLAGAFDKAAKECPQLFERFRQHPQYHYSRLLSEALQTLDLGGGIIRDNAPLQHFRVWRYVAGDYGKSKLDLLNTEQVEAVRNVAERIRSLFRVRQSSACHPTK